MAKVIYTDHPSLGERLKASRAELSDQDWIGFIAIKEDWGLDTVQSADVHLIVGHLRVGNIEGELVAAKIWKDKVDRMVVAFWLFMNPDSVIEVLDVPRIPQDPRGLARELLQIRMQGQHLRFEPHNGWSG